MSAVPGSYVVIHFSAMILECDVRKTAVADDRLCFLQLYSPRNDAPLTAFPKAIIQKFLRLNFSVLLGGKVSPGDYVFEIFLI